MYSLISEFLAPVDITRKTDVGHFYVSILFIHLEDSVESSQLNYFLNLRQLTTQFCHGKATGNFQRF